MSKSYKRNNKYSDDENYGYDNYSHRQHLKEKRIRAALRTKSKSDLLDLYEED